MREELPRAGRGAEVPGDARGVHGSPCRAPLVPTVRTPSATVIERRPSWIMALVSENPFPEEVRHELDQIAGNWKQVKGTVKEKWGKLTDDDLTTIAGKRDQLAGLLQEKYGYEKEQAEKELDEFLRSLKP